MFITICQASSCFQFTKKLNDWNLGKVYMAAYGYLLVVCGHLLVACGPKTQNYQFKLKFEYAEFNGDVHVFYFKPEMSILGKPGVIKQIC